MAPSRNHVSPRTHPFWSGLSLANRHRAYPKPVHYRKKNFAHTQFSKMVSLAKRHRAYPKTHTHP